MTPFEKAKELLADLREAADAIGLTLPGNSSDVRNSGYYVYAQIGPQKITCESTIVGTLGSNPIATDLGESAQAFQNYQCGPGQVGNFLITLTRECSTAEEDGTENVPLVQELSELQDADHDFLWTFASEYAPAQLGVPFLSKSFNIQHSFTGGLAITSLTFSIGID